MATLVQSNLIPYLEIKVILYIVQTQYPSKSWFFKSYLPIKVRKQQQIKFQCKTPLFSTSLLVLTTFPIMSNNKLFFYFSYFSALCLFPICSQNCPYTPNQHFLPPYFIHFSSPCLLIQPSLQSQPILFSLTSAIKLIQIVSMAEWVMKSLKIETVLISHCFLKPWKGTTVLTITGSLLLRQNFCIAESNLWWRYLNTGRPTIPPTFPIPSTYYHYFSTILIPSKDLTCFWKAVA